MTADKPTAWPLEWCGVCRRHTQCRREAKTCFWCGSLFGEGPSRDEVEAAREPSFSNWWFGDDSRAGAVWDALHLATPVKVTDDMTLTMTVAECKALCEAAWIAAREAL